MSSSEGPPPDGRWTRWGKQGFNKSIAISDWISPYANAVSAKVGAERFWPQSNDMVEEIEKCVRILRAFTVEGVAQKEVKQEKVQDAKGTWIQKKVRVMRKIPPAAIRNAKGIAIFSSMRSGIAPFGGGGGSGMILARLSDGSWSAPSAVTPQNASAGLLLGIDFLDCILLINSDKAMKSFMSHRVDIGAETGLTAGPYGSGVSAEAGFDRAPIYSYVRTRGAYAGVELMGQVFLHRFDENERFYYTPHISAKDILSGKVRIPPTVYSLHRALRDAESGRAQAGRLERTEYDLIKLPESEVFDRLGPNASKKKKRFVAGMTTPSVYSEQGSAVSPVRGSESSRTSLESLDPEADNERKGLVAAAHQNGPAEGLSLKDLQIDTSIVGRTSDDEEEDEDIVHDGEKLRLPPTPAELEMMEAAGLKDDEDLRLEAEERKRIYKLPAPPIHANVKRYWSMRPTLGSRRPTDQLVMDGPHPPEIHAAQFVPLPGTPPEESAALPEIPPDVPPHDEAAESAAKVVDDFEAAVDKQQEKQQDGEGEVIASGLTEQEAENTMQAAADGATAEEIREEVGEQQDSPGLELAEKQKRHHSSDSQLTISSLAGAGSDFKDAEEERPSSAQEEEPADDAAPTQAPAEETAAQESAPKDEEIKPLRPPRRKR